MSAAPTIELTDTQRATQSVLARCATPLTFLITDIVALILAYATTAAMTLGSGGPSHETRMVAPLLLGVVIVGCLLGLYPSFLVSPVEELRLLTIANVGGMCLAALCARAIYNAKPSTAWIFIATIPVGLLCSVTLRWAMRRLCMEARWWGLPTILVGPAAEVETIRGDILAKPSLGIRVTETLELDGSKFCSDYSRSTSDYNAEYALLIVPIDADSKWVQRATDLVSRCRRIILVPQAIGLLAQTMTPRNCCGLPGLEVKRQLLQPHCRFLKRTLDLVVASVLGLLLSPLVLLIALLVRVGSAGTAFYGHWRVGESGRPFRVWKFRTMVKNADQVLEQHLASDPLLRWEWQTTHKLKNDPRVTPLGKVLRQTSLDEIPQIWNVIRGDMSLVGPRPIVLAEACRYGEEFEIYRKVRPGITGLWQVSGRSDTSYQQRVALDTQYVRNWSFWLDIYLLSQTIAVVLYRRGAY